MGEYIFEMLDFHDEHIKQLSSCMLCLGIILQHDTFYAT